MYYNGRLIEGFYTCSYFFDYVLERKNETYFEFMEGLLTNIFHHVFDWKNIIIACFDTIAFAAKTDDFELYSSCFEECMLEYADPSSVNCLDLCVQYEKGNFLADDFCFVCRRHVSFYLLVKNFHIIAKRKNGNNLL